MVDEPQGNYKDLSKYYSASKCCVLGSLIEGKNRFISESQSCDVPIIVFKDFNKYSRGDFPVFFGNAGATDFFGQTFGNCTGVKLVRLKFAVTNLFDGVRSR